MHIVYEIKFMNEVTGGYSKAAIRQYQSVNSYEAFTKYKERHGIDWYNTINEEFRVVEYMGSRVVVAGLECAEGTESRVLVIVENNLELNDDCIADIMILNDDLVSKTIKQWNKCGYDKYKKRKRQIIKVLYEREYGKVVNEDAVKDMINRCTELKGMDIMRFNEAMSRDNKYYMQLNMGNILKYRKAYKWR